MPAQACLKNPVCLFLIWFDLAQQEWARLCHAGSTQLDTPPGGAGGPVAGDALSSFLRNSSYWSVVISPFTRR